MIEAQMKIDGFVDAYQKLYKEEFAEFLKGQKAKALDRTKWGEMKASDYVIRGLVEIPETLYNLLHMRLEPDEWKYFDSLEGKKWFGKKYPQYLITDKI